KTSIENAELGLLISQLDKEKNRQDIRFLIAGYYPELQKIQNQKRILNRNIVQTATLLEQIQNKVREGLALKNEVVRYELQKQSVELALLKLENHERIINHELVKTLQLPEGTVLEAKAPVEHAAGKLPVGEEWQKLALENAPVLKQTGLQLQQAINGEGLARSERLPQVFAFAGEHLDGPIMIEVPP